MPKTFLLPIFLIALVMTCGAHSSGKNKRPNFVWLISEDSSRRYLNLYHPQGAAMPNVEFLAAQGLVFTNAFSNAPVCSTARTTLATGAYGPRIGTMNHRAYHKVKLPADLQPLSKIMKQAGYYTTNKVKEDYNFNSSTPLWDNSSPKAHWRQRKQGQPFYHVQSFGVTHESSLHFPLQDVNEKKPQHNANSIVLPPIYPNTDLFRYTYARTLDNHSVLNKQIGKVLDELKQDGLLEDTFVFYFSDHGGALPGSKGYLFERGLAIPLVIRIPANFKHLVGKKLRQANKLNVKGFVSFVDFAPTLLNLAGIPAQSQHDGTAFLGPDIDKKDIDKRDTTYGYADRFDEKIDLVRSLRKGQYKYIRNYLPYYPDSLDNTYRYRQQAFAQWREAYKNGNLNPIQSAFFKTKTTEALYDIEKDPYETNNLAKHKAYKGTLLSLRKQLQEQLKSLPDLGFYPEPWLLQHATGNPVAYGQDHKSHIASLIDIADLQLDSFNKAKVKLLEAIKSQDEWTRYWALITLSRFGSEAKEFYPTARIILAKEKNRLVKARAIEFLALNDQLDPVPALEKLIAQTSDDMEILTLLNIASLFREMKGSTFQIPTRPEWKAPAVGSKYYQQRKIISYYFTNRLGLINKPQTLPAH